MLDKITCISAQSFINQLRATFVVDLCETEENYYGSISYQWDFGDGDSAGSHIPTETHVYKTQGNWTFSVAVWNAVSGKNFTSTLTFEPSMRTLYMCMIEYAPFLKIFMHSLIKETARLLKTFQH